MSKQKVELPFYRSDVIPISTGIAAGCLLYVFQLRASQYLLKALNIHAGLPFISSIIGGCSLSLAFLQSSTSMLAVMNFIRTKHFKEQDIKTISVQNMASSCFINLIVVKYILQQQFRSTLPSHVIFPGSFARTFVPLHSNNVSKKCKLQIQKLGSIYGCHHCGNKVSHYIADHIPCTKFLPEFTQKCNVFYNTVFLYLFQRKGSCWKKYNQVVYPQCIKCCKHQAGFVSGKTFLRAVFQRKGIIMHKLRYHRYFIFLFPIHFLMDIV